MKQVFYCLCSLLLASCGAVVRNATGTTAEAAMKQASVEYGCPMEKIKLLEKASHTGNATYALDVCGTRRVYIQVGSTLQEKK